MRNLMYRLAMIAVAGFVLTACPEEPEVIDTCTGEGFETCGDDCVNTNNDGKHCGGCNNACTEGNVCTDGVCVGGETCDGAGQEVCGGECVNTDTNALHCGGCNNACGGGSTCESGSCTCAGGLTYCGDACVNTDTDPAHCGGCLSPCGANQGCYLGGCATAYPESCDGQDNDLDGDTDEDENGNALTRPCDNLCGAGTETCSGGTYIGCTAPTPDNEVCNGEDDNCDGLIDEGVTNTYYEDYDGDGYGDPDLAFATEACSLPTEPSPSGGVYVEDNSDCDDIDETVYPGAVEACDGVDNNCDGHEDENCACTPEGGTRPCGSDVGICAPGLQTCSTSTGWGECAGPDYVAPLPAELCNGLDDDCDGDVDEEMGDDRYENNDICAVARGLPDIREGEDPTLFETLSLYHGSSEAVDTDWYMVRVREADHTIECTLAGWPPLQTQCDFLYFATLTVPSDAVHQDYEMCIHTGLCGEFDNTFCTTAGDYNQADHSYTMVLAWDGTCGIDDSWDFYVEVKNTLSGANSCENYSLEFAMGWTGDIGDVCNN